MGPMYYKINNIIYKQLSEERLERTRFNINKS